VPPWYIVIIVTIVVVLLLFIFYTINLPVVRPRSCQVIYYFDTPALGRRHQFFGRVTHTTIRDSFIQYNTTIDPS
jgi:hypothetical protein